MATEIELSSTDNISYNVTCCETPMSQCFCNNSNASWTVFNTHHNIPPVMGPPMYMYVYVSVVNALVFLVGIIGNVLVIQVVARTKSMRRRMNYFLVSLSVADLLVLVVCLPIALLEFYGKDKWYIGEAMCKIVPFLENASHHCSVLTLLAIGFERYYAICHPLKKTVGARFRSTNILIPAVWMLSCVVSLPFAIISNIEETRYYDDSIVEVCRTDMSSKLSRAYIIFIFTVCLALPLLLLTAMYAAIIRTLAISTMNNGEFKVHNTSPGAGSRHSCHNDNDTFRNARAMASRRQVVRMMVAVMGLYFLCLLPIRCVQLWVVFGSEKDLEKLGFEGYLNLINCVRILISVNSAGNPIIYGLLSSNFRVAFRQSFFNCRSGSRDQWRYNTTYYNNNHHHHYLYQQTQGSVSHVNNHDVSPAATPCSTFEMRCQNTVEDTYLRSNSPSPPCLRKNRASEDSDRRETCSPGAEKPLIVHGEGSDLKTKLVGKEYKRNGSNPTYV